MNLNEDFQEDFDGQLPEEATPGQIVWTAIILLASALFSCSVLWIAWRAIRDRIPGDLLMLSGIMVALPAVLAIQAASYRERDREMFGGRR